MFNAWYALAGKNRELTVAELAHQLPYLQGENKTLYSVSEGYAKIKAEGSGPVLTISGQILSEESINRFGGIVKAGQWITEVPESSIVKSLVEIMQSSKRSRYDIGLSAYGSIGQRTLAQYALTMKKMLKAGGKPVRVVFDRVGIEVSPVVVKKQLLEKGGTEFVLLQAGSLWRIGRTTWVHQFEEWGEREFSKPDVDSRRGLLPQKLARIMVNLAGIPLGPDTTIYDPFCGSGVVLMEARELGCQIFGSDLEHAAVVATRANVGLSADSDLVWEADARRTAIPKNLREGRGTIVTEPYLGPVWNHEPSSSEKEEVIHELVELYIASLKHWRQGLATGTPIVMVFPVIFGTPLFPKIVDRLQSLQYSSAIKPIRYERSDAYVARDIVRLVAQ